MKKNEIAIIVVVVIVIALIVGFIAMQKTKSISSNSKSSAPSTPSSLRANQPPRTLTPIPTIALPAGEVILARSDRDHGTFLTDDKGITLYFFDKDTQGVSNCNDQCATTWPPYTTNGAISAILTAGVTTFKRSDGSTQYAWKGKPLYYYAKDTKPGDIAGNGVGGVWHIVTP